MEFFRALIDGYGTLILTVLGAIAIVKAALAISKDGLRKALSRGVAFVAVAAALAYLVNPFLNWLFIRTQANVGQNLFAQSAVQLARDTASIIENASVSGEPIHVDTTQLYAADTGNTATTQNAIARPAERAANAAPASVPQSNAIERAAANITNNGYSSRPLIYSPEYESTISAATPTQIPLVFMAAQNTATPAPVATQPARVLGVPETPLMLIEAADGDGGGPQTYTVQAGDSLSRIAGRFGVSVKALCRANDLRDCNIVARGKKLVIP